MQVRKLFEPAKFPLAFELLEIFDQYFGPVETRRQNTCVVGFEPNVAHHPNLNKMSHTYSDLGWSTLFYPYAASNVYGNELTFFNDPGSHHAVGASLFNWMPQNDKGISKYSVLTVDVGDFIRNVIAFHQPAKVIMKLDIEGIMLFYLAYIMNFYSCLYLCVCLFIFYLHCVSCRCGIRCITKDD